MLHVHLVVRVDVVGVGLGVTGIQSRDVVNHMTTGIQSREVVNYMTTGIQSRDVDKKTWESYVNLFLLKGRGGILFSVPMTNHSVSGSESHWSMLPSERQ